MYSMQLCSFPFVVLFKTRQEDFVSRFLSISASYLAWRRLQKQFETSILCFITNFTVQVQIKCSCLCVPLCMFMCFNVHNLFINKGSFFNNESLPSYDTYNCINSEVYAFKNGKTCCSARKR